MPSCTDYYKINRCRKANSFGNFSTSFIIRTFARPQIAFPADSIYSRLIDEHFTNYKWFNIIYVQFFPTPLFNTFLFKKIFNRLSRLLYGSSRNCLLGCGKAFGLEKEGKSVNSYTMTFADRSPCFLSYEENLSL
jgi:hypothetical protein